MVEVGSKDAVEGRKENVGPLIKLYRNYDQEEGCLKWIKT